MYIKTSESKKSVQNRLSRIEGQIRGIKGMIQEEQDCREILRQLSAVRSSLQSTTRYFLQTVINECDNPEGEGTLTQKEITSELLELINENMRG